MISPQITGTLATIGLMVTPAIIAANPSDTEAGSGDEIVVIGQLERKERIGNFIRSSIHVSLDEQYARFQAPVCPLALGFAAGKKQVIEKRIRLVAASAGAKTARDDCEPNFLIVASVDPPDTIAWLRKKHSRIFGGMYIPERNRLMKQPGPAYAWNVVNTVFTEGATAVSVEAGDDEGIATSSGTGSRIRQATNQNIERAILMIRSDGLMHINHRQLADYAIMRLLANAKMPKSGQLPEPTILSLFSEDVTKGEKPQSVTEWDLALLRALYMSPDNLNAQQMRRNMARVFETELVRIAQETRTPQAIRSPEATPPDR